jgi:Flp pilus assembly pilin Flp
MKNQNGQALTEYLILLLLVAVISIGAVKTLGSTIEDKIRMAKDHINKDVTLKP